jgi:hypothetical protein
MTAHLTAGVSKSRGEFGAAEQRLRHSSPPAQGDDPEMLRIAAAGLAFRAVLFD